MKMLNFLFNFFFWKIYKLYLNIRYLDKGQFGCGVFVNLQKATVGITVIKFFLKNLAIMVYRNLDILNCKLSILNCKLSLDLQNYVRPSVRTTISPAVFIGFFQYRTQGSITMSRASWMKST